MEKSSKADRLYGELFRLIIAEKFHLNKVGSTKERWTSFCGKLFGDGTAMNPGQPSFRGLEGSWRNVHEHYKSKLKDVALHHGWLDGGCTGNLSGQECELRDVDTCIKFILQDLEQEKEEKDAAKELKGQCH